MDGQVHALKDRAPARTKKMAAAADYARDVQVRTKESIVQDFLQLHRLLLLFFARQLFFPQSFVDAAVYRTSSSEEKL